AGCVHHGFKAMSISASALTAEALKLTMPASAFSRSTEAHNQDKVPMGAIAARETLRILDLTETVAGISLLALAQAVDLRGDAECPDRARALRDAVRTVAPPLTTDRAMDVELGDVVALHRAGGIPHGAVPPTTLGPGEAQGPRP
ncbi:MAG: aromatic amino acid lyase, partial [Myxococcota bacterium]|nr:aromatic amino acid lyase [Myxococcota bacterium]